MASLFHYKCPLKLTQIRSFGLKINHLATPVSSHSESVLFLAGDAAKKVPLKTGFWSQFIFCLTLAFLAKKLFLLFTGTKKV
jgi:hypothetical protein